MKLAIFKGQDIKNRPYRRGNLTVRIVTQIPDAPIEPTKDYRVWKNDRLKFFEQQGQSLADALVEYLPGGTLDQLTRALLQHQASLFVHSHADHKEKE